MIVTKVRKVISVRSKIYNPWIWSDDSPRRDLIYAMYMPYTRAMRFNRTGKRLLCPLLPLNTRVSLRPFRFAPVAAER